MKNDFRFRVEIARKQQKRDAIETAILVVAVSIAMGAFLYFAPDAIHGSFAFQDTIANAYH